jgi:hypothetical protein
MRFDASPRFSTATNTIAAFRPFSWRLPRMPGCSPPPHVSSISTSPYSGSRAALTIARRSLCRSIQAVSYRRKSNWRWSSSAEMPRLSVTVR